MNDIIAYLLLAPLVIGLWCGVAMILYCAYEEFIK